MRTILILLLILSLVSCKKDPVENAQPEPTVSKTVTFQVAQVRDYSPSVYDGVKAEAVLTVSKDIYNSTASTVLWDTTLTMRDIRQYPAVTNPQTITKQFSGITESKEAVRVSVVLRYTNPQNQNSMQAFGEPILRNTLTKTVPVGL